jgi:SAM-dependent methyltransferase
MVTQALKERTALAYGHLWRASGSAPDEDKGHYAGLQSLLPLSHLRGRVLDAGCGVGRDSWQMASKNGAQVWSIDLSWEGVRKTQERVRSFANAIVLQGDVEHLPFQAEAFDFVYSFGVLHHLPSPQEGFKELIRVLKPGGLLALYVYEDFSTRSRFERVVLNAVGATRWITTRLPHRPLYLLCWVASPFVFLIFTVPYRLSSRLTWMQALSNRIPFRHGRSWFSLTGDLYDRFAAPYEHRYSTKTLESWFQEGNLTGIRIVPHRGWVAFGVKR